MDNSNIFLAIISIHVPRVGDDQQRRAVPHHHAGISIHVPRVGDDGKRGTTS